MLIALKYILIACCLLPQADHPVHVSLTNIEYHSETNSFEIMFKIFEDDFQAAVRQQSGVLLRLETEQEHPQADTYINRYVFEHFKLKINEKDQSRQQMQLTKRFINEQAVWLYYSYPDIPKVNQISVYNSILTDYYIDQTNLIYFSYIGDVQAYIFDRLVIEQILPLE